MKKAISLISLCALCTIIYSSLFAQKSTTGIKVSTAFAGTLSFQGNEIANLKDNGTHTIPIERPGTYLIKIRFADGGGEMSKMVEISSGVVEVGFYMPPKNIRIGNAGIDSFKVSWDSEGSGVQYNVYCNTENNLNSARVQRMTDTTITFKELEYNKTYYVWVSVVIGNYRYEKEGAKSSVISQKLLETKLFQVGPGGGIVFYDKLTYSDGWRYLEAAPVEIEFTAQWGAYEKDINGTNTAVGTGKQNTRLIVDALNRFGETGKAAQLCASLNFGGFNDWFLPSRGELDLMYENLWKRGLGNFIDQPYWSSSQNGNIHASFLSFNYHGNKYYIQYGHGFKSNGYRVRAIRAF